MDADLEPRRVAITVAPNGGRRTKADHPSIPLTAAELARTAAECLEAGASMIHVHVRRPDGVHSLDVEAYRAATAAIRAEVGGRLVIQITTESLGMFAPAEQISMLKAVRPEAASLALRELAPDEAAEPLFADTLEWMRQHAVLPQIILYDPSEAMRLFAMIKRGLVPWTDIPVLFVLGRYSPNQTSRPSDLLPFLGPDMPRFSNWSACAFGRYEQACVMTAAMLGGHVRVGFENNLLMPDGELAESNAALVKAVSTAAKLLGLYPANAASVRTLFSPPS
nr:3-keto-5-aminohexanoate cleavage protein [Mesorhizobium sp.]